MAVDPMERTLRNGMVIASALVVTGLLMAGLSLREIMAVKSQEMAQATRPLQGSTPEPQKTAPPIRQK